MSFLKIAFSKHLAKIEVSATGLKSFSSTILSFFGIGINSEHFQELGNLWELNERLKIIVKMGHNWDALAFTIRPCRPSGPHDLFPLVSLKVRLTS